VIHGKEPQMLAHLSGQFGRKSVSGLVVLVLTCTALGACGQSETLLAVNASATTRTAPDLAIVTLGVQARGESARSAQAAQAQRMGQVLEAARTAGVSDTAIQTIGLSIEPQYSYQRGQAPRISGYVSSNTVAIRIRDLDAVSGLIDATVAEGANQLHSIQFTYEDEEASREAARAEALAAARCRAERYAETAGLRVVAMRSIIEPGSVLPPSARRGDALGAVVEQAANVSPINPGELDNRASVTVVFALR
jgi:uncharacterized protein YggE